MFEIRKRQTKVSSHVTLVYPSFKDGQSRAFIGLLIAFIVIFSFNFKGLYFDGLWHDDGLWYYFQTGLESSAFKGWRSNVGFLVPYNDYIYSLLMVEYSPFFARLCYLLLLSFASFLLYRLYIKLFGFTIEIALLAAVLPLILPGVFIPIGLNAAYPVPALFFSALLMNYSMYLKDKPGIQLWKHLLPFLFISLLFVNINPSALFLGPAVFLISVFCLRDKKTFLALYIVPFSLFSLVALYMYWQGKHKTPTSINFETVSDRVSDVIQTSDLLTYQLADVLWVPVGLMAIGVIGLLCRSNAFFRVQQKETYLSWGILAWVVTWICSNIIVYVSMTPSWRVHDYAFVSNFGMVLLQVLGLFFVIYRFPLNRPSRLVVVVGVLVYVGGVKLKSALENEPITRTEQTSALIRETLVQAEYESGSQFILADVNTQHPGNYRVNSGYLRYVMRDKAISGIIGTDFFPNAPFDKAQNWFDTMKNLDEKKPVFGFRKIGNHLQKVDYLLSVSENPESLFPRVYWTLYKINKKPEGILSGAGMTNYLASLERAGIDRENVLFAPKALLGEFISPADFALLVANESVLFKESSVDETFSIYQAESLGQESELKQHELLELVIHVKKEFKKGFKLGYTINNGKMHSIEEVRYFKAGDYFSINLGSVVNERERVFQLYQLNIWPHKKLKSVSLVNRRQR